MSAKFEDICIDVVGIINFKKTQKLRKIRGWSSAKTAHFMVNLEIFKSLLLRTY